MKYITRTVWILSVVSLLTDMASEMLYPVMPLYLKQVGYSAVFIGVLEGIAEAVAGLSKSYFGKKSDAAGKRLPFVQFGYALSALSKPMLAVFTYPWWIFFARTTDRFGKGVRTGARDALLSDESAPGTRAKVFGFHRGMDTFGAVFGPAIALAYLLYYPGDYRTLFILAFIPGLLSILSTFLLKERTRLPANKKAITKTTFFEFTSYWKVSSLPYRKLVIGLLIFALFNSSDVFLLLKMKESGMTDATIIGVYIFYNLVFALMAFPLGALADKVGLKKVFIAGLCLFTTVYTGFALNDSFPGYIILFTLYGIYAAATEGISKAWISKVAPREETASAIGTYSGLQSLCALIASSFCGFLWYQFGHKTALLLTAAATFAVILYFLSNPLQKKVDESSPDIL